MGRPDPSAPTSCVSESAWEIRVHSLYLQCFIIEMQAAGIELETEAERERERVKRHIRGTGSVIQPNMLCVPRLSLFAYKTDSLPPSLPLSFFPSFLPSTDCLLKPYDMPGTVPAAGPRGGNTGPGLTI